MHLPERYDHRAAEARWRAAWLDGRIYRFDPADPRPVFSIDTPPPTVSGVLHVGHVFSYTQTDLIARYQRMRGRRVFYPMGYDDNGLPTERRVQNVHNVRCGPADKRPRTVSRQRFRELCEALSQEDEAAFEELWRRLGLSVDWNLRYRTIDNRCRRVSQLDFLRLVEKGQAYSADAPTAWDVEFATAVAQAETEEREVEGLEYRLRFGLEGGGMVTVMTTRPELLGACVAVVVHPNDERYRGLAGSTALTPGYGVSVPIMGHHLADPDKGTGAVMVCTFGDVTDVTWWRELALPARSIVGRDGRLLPAPWGAPGWECRDSDAAQRLHEHVAGLPIARARRAIAERLADPDAAMDGTGTVPIQSTPQPVRRHVRFYEKGSRPLEILPARQWFIRLLDKREALLEQGRRVQWHPASMLRRYEQWIEGLSSDWCVSRQRYLGVPIPLWYPLDGDGEPDYDHPILPDARQVPVDPSADTPPGHSEHMRDRPGGFTGERDVLDTWATSSLTPRIATGWPDDTQRFERLYPMDLRPQAHEIIRTWAFYTVARAHMLDGRAPWRHIMVSGWVVDPERKKMSKSAGNVVTPTELLDRYGADAVRHWAASARTGTDTAYDESGFRVGKRLATKLFHAGRLIVGRLQAAGALPGACLSTNVTAPLDRAHLALLASVIDEASRHMEDFEPAQALAAVEQWFWSNLCDNYLELTKARAYAGDASALAAWDLSLSAATRLLAPFLPYVADEVWSWHHGHNGRSVHQAPWPEAAEVNDELGGSGVFGAAVCVLAHIRRHKSESGVSLRAPVKRGIVTGQAERLNLLRLALEDVASAGAVEHMELRPWDREGMAVELDMAD